MTIKVNSLNNITVDGNSFNSPEDAVAQLGVNKGEFDVAVLTYEGEILQKIFHQSQEIIALRAERDSLAADITERDKPEKQRELESAQRDLEAVKARISELSK